MQHKAEIMDEAAVERALVRISHQIIEKNHGTESLCLIGIRTRGVPIAERIAANIEHIEGKKPPVGVLDITLYRDDLSSLSYQPIVHQTELPVDITGKTIVLVDDVLYTGRTVRAALDALRDIGRPGTVQLAVLVDDILTTGATAEVCARLLLYLGASEVCLLTATRVP